MNRGEPTDYEETETERFEDMDVLYCCYAGGRAVLRDEDALIRFFLHRNGGGYTDNQTARTMEQLSATRDGKTFKTSTLTIDRVMPI